MYTSCLSLITILLKVRFQYGPMGDRGFQSRLYIETVGVSNNEM